MSPILKSVGLCILIARAANFRNTFGNLTGSGNVLRHAENSVSYDWRPLNTQLIPDAVKNPIETERDGRKLPPATGHSVGCSRFRFRSIG